MAWKIEDIVQQIEIKNPLHAKKLKRSVKKMDSVFFERSEKFLTTYQILLAKEEKTIDYSIDCYLRMISDFNFEAINFLETGSYSSSSFEEVNQRVYGQPEIMGYYMHGLLLSQFLFFHHYEVLLFFNEVINKEHNLINRYLEIGGGHGLYISEAIETIGGRAHYDMVDISESSLELAQKLVKHSEVQYIHKDVFNFEPIEKYDFITMGEVLEHVEDPISLLKRIGDFLNENGKLFITTPTNAPAIDHIYLFKNAKEIRDLINEAGFVIETEFCIFSEDLAPEVAEKFNISMLFAGVLTKKIK
jgi:2-polyprenyl-3-methyl-5-hydroxy-6-metoxy-1,4-benzoquinol methylase